MERYSAPVACRRAARLALRAGLAAVAFLLVLAAASGCGNPQVTPANELAAFDKLGSVSAPVDLDHIAQAKAPSGPYRVIAGDLVELQVPALMVMGASEKGGVTTLLCRAGESGKIVLPVVGELQVVGKTLQEVEAATTAAYYPKYVVSRPSVVARVAEYHTTSVAIVGAVRDPGVYPLRHDEMSLVSLLMKAKGIAPEGASAIRVRHAGGAGAAEPATVPLKDTTVPFTDVALAEGDVVEVERRAPEVFTVLGLVQRPGTFPYQPGVKYTLMQALAFAGGLDNVTNPQFVTVYRPTGDGKVVPVTLPLDREGIVGPSNLTIKPGDVVAVEHTPGTQTRQILAQMLRFGFGVNAGYDFAGR